MRCFAERRCRKDNRNTYPRKRASPAASKVSYRHQCGPNHPFERWLKLKHKQSFLNFIFDDSDDTILDNIEKAKRESAAVLIDLEGTKNTRVTYAISQSDLVLIPIQGSILDAQEAAEAIKLIKRAEQAFKRKIDFAILFTRMPAAIVPKNFSDIARRFSDSEIPVLEAQLIEREAFKTMFSCGKEHRYLEPKPTVCRRRSTIRTTSLTPSSPALKTTANNPHRPLPERKQAMTTASTTGERAGEAQL